MHQQQLGSVRVCDAHGGGEDALGTDRAVQRYEDALRRREARGTDIPTYDEYRAPGRRENVLGRRTEAPLGLAALPVAPENCDVRPELARQRHDSLGRAALL